ncbi:MAG TPA: cobalamin biosynthesis protein, partial [Candidatus Dormibacteraeota bacterium]|nr:cobalamin biosynthesis protein [Candidatus Dormibacteraeota bacterium]
MTCRPELPLRSRRARALPGAVALDLALGDPGDGWHPVAVMGRMLAAGHERFRAARPLAQLLGGAGSVAAVGLLTAAVGAGVERLARGRAGAVLLGAALKPTFALRQLITEALAVASALEADDLARARRQLRALVSRPTDALEPP